MCGIFAVINKKDKNLDLDLCKNALNSLNRRGPDDQSYILKKNKYFFGQTLLSITGELKRNSIRNQVSLDNKFQILFKGQIYNFY